ncbi:uncharacterized protein CIMG_07608 [Coccidioides immitis RS]|uniref:Uncharacterized protein n=2 Tax=Coccidioides immitis TaxID=5501 RepID=J3K3R7_COCIM|nr:uncharacterized protein CIMG_07608 [Coccidioides immitis RS]EAS28862.3 hypothetical protein CIMG_07608 [Coccidioides immitis RS]KMP05979.1 hypothetical protein CIRG_05660 [Coccidioides immitis RMSCC 2394]TPX22965.1 hypothetical protein DIZ76_014846 [Coccidioides immitis]
MLPRTLSLRGSLHPFARLLRRDPSSSCRVFQRHSSGKRDVLASAKPVPTPKASAALRLKPASPPSTRSDERFRKFNFQISQASGPVEIFKAPSHRSYILGAVSVATFCYLYAGYNFYTTSIDPLMQVAKWQEYTFAGICVVMAAMGTVFLRRGGNLIASITASRPQGQQTQLSIKVRRMVPFPRQREIIATPDQISFSRQLVVPHSQMSEEGRAAAQKRWESERAVSQMAFFKAPLKKTSHAFWKFFVNSRRLFTQEHFAYVKIEGQTADFRLDTLGTFSSELLLLQKVALQSAL